MTGPVPTPVARATRRHPPLPVPLRSAPMCRAVTDRVVAGRDRMPDRLRTTGPCRSATPPSDASPHHHPDPAVRGSHLGRPCRSVHAASRARGLRSAAGSASARSRAGRVATLCAADRPPRVSVQWRPSAPETRRRSVATQCADAGPSDATAYKNQRPLSAPEKTQRGPSGVRRRGTYKNQRKWTRLPQFGRSPSALTRHRQRAPR